MLHQSERRNKMISQRTKKYLCFILIPLISGILAVLVPIIERQAQIAHSTIISILLFFYCVVTILLIISPARTIIRDILVKKRWLYYLLIFILLVLPLFSWIILPITSKSILWYFVWYVLPTLIFIIPTFLDEFKFDFIFHISAVILFAVGFDKRYTNLVLQGLDFSYEINALWISSLILLVYSIQYQNYEEKFNWKITRNKLILPLTLSLILAIIIIPIGLLTNFLVWSPEWPGALMFFFSFIGIWLTIALPEEIIARGVIQQQLTDVLGDSEHRLLRHWKWFVLVLASSIFGLSHWNNTTSEFAWVYILLATIAGIFYGYCWWKGGLFSAMLIHTFVDWIWGLFFVSP